MLLLNRRETAEIRIMSGVLNQVGASGRDIDLPLRLEFNERYDLMQEDECLLGQKSWTPDSLRGKF